MGAVVFVCLVALEVLPGPRTLYLAGVRDVYQLVPSVSEPLQTRFARSAATRSVS